MIVSIFLARVLGLYFIIVSLAVLFRFKYFQTAYDELVVSKANVLFGAVLSLIVGILIVVAHPIFIWNWRLLITVMGYLTLIKGIMLLFFPEYTIKFKRSMMSNRSLYFILIVIFLLIGLVFAYRGFVCPGF